MYKCLVCGSEFNNEQGLNDHKRAKHFKPEKKLDKKIIFYFFSGLVIVFIVLSIGWLATSIINSDEECKTKDARELFITSHTKTKFHIHSQLEIIINGERQLIPANVGVDNVMRPVHTHDSSGELHIEGPCVRDFTLNDFFNIWNKEFNSSCIFDYCNGSLKMTVDGNENKEFENLILRDKQKISIEFKEAK